MKSARHPRMSLLVGLVSLLASARCFANPPTSAEALRLTFGVALGVAYFTQARSETTDASSQAREQFRLMLPCHLGANGFGFDVVPGVGLGDVSALSIYAGPALDLPLQRFVLRFGAGLWLGRNFDAGVYRNGIDLYGRLPLTLAYGIGERLALFASLGLGFGATQVAIAGVAAMTMRRTNREFRSATALDVAVGAWF
jgi:hypothetical protein